LQSYSNSLAQKNRVKISKEEGWQKALKELNITGDLLDTSTAEGQYLNWLKSGLVRDNLLVKNNTHPPPFFFFSGAI